MRRRSMILFMLVAIALVGAACGRATQDQVNQALGITPTPTASAAELAAATEAANATAAARLQGASSPAAAAALGDVTQGRRQFMTWCTGCHRAGGQGPDILSPGSPGASVSAESLLPLIREGAGHDPPGPFGETQIRDNQIADIAAYLNSEAGS